MTRYAHAMPFGAEISADGGVRFKLWAPAAKKVEVVLEDMDRQAFPLTGLEDGWFGLDTRAARAGSRYRFRIDGKTEVPDPASRFNPEDVHGPSQVVDPNAFEWNDDGWRAPPWREAVIYELHVGTFTREGTFRAAIDRLDHLVELGVNTVELMPLADFPGRRNWGYDGVLQFAPDSSYGTPEDLKSLVAAAHARGLAIMLDVVYNHFGPEGNYLNAYAPLFFTDRHRTPWGAAINYDADGSLIVRRFFVHNVLYWLNEYRFDGLRFDAVHAIRDDSSPDILLEIAEEVRSETGADRHVYLVLENDANQARYLAPLGDTPRFDAQWNDDAHHCLHVIATGESDGYYRDYADRPHERLARCLAEGFAYQGEASAHRGGEKRGEPSAGLPPRAFVNFLQNHDQIGNRALGERIGALAKSEEALRAVMAVLLLAPSPPMLFMGEEWNAPEPFTYFCDFEPDLAEKVREGRKREFASFESFAKAERSGRPVVIPDACAASTFEGAKLDWSRLAHSPHREWLEFRRSLLALRRREIAPRLAGWRTSRVLGVSDGALAVEWALEGGARLRLLANLADRATTSPAAREGRELFAIGAGAAPAGADRLAPWSVIFTLSEG